MATASFTGRILLANTTTDGGSKPTRHRLNSGKSGGTMNRVKERYCQIFGLPAEQIKFFDELTESQVALVRRYFTAGLINAGSYIYATRRDGGLVMRREKRNTLIERGAL